jgi:hypothetical protein
MIGRGFGVDIFADASQGVLTQAHDPGEQELATAGEGGLGESGLEEGDNGFERAYHSPHGGTSLSSETVITFKDMRNPLLLHLGSDQKSSGQAFR